LKDISPIKNLAGTVVKNAKGIIAQNNISPTFLNISIGYFVIPSSSFATANNPFLGLDTVKLAKIKKMEYQIKNATHIDKKPKHTFTKVILPKLVIM